MFCSLALAVPDTVVWRFEIAFMATLFEIEGNLKYELVDKIADGRMRGCFGPTRSRSVMMSFEGDVKLSDFGVTKAAGLIDQNEGEQRDLGQVHEGIAAGQGSGLNPTQAHHGFGIWFSV